MRICCFCVKEMFLKESGQIKTKENMDTNRNADCNGLAATKIIYGSDKDLQILNTVRIVELVLFKEEVHVHRLRIQESAHHERPCTLPPFPHLIYDSRNNDEDDDDDNGFDDDDDDKVACIATFENANKVLQSFVA